MTDIAVTDDEHEAFRDCCEKDQMIYGGYMTVDEVIDFVFDEAKDSIYEEVTRDGIAVLVREAFAKKLEEEASWPAVTDFDRLTAVFDELNANGYICLHHPSSTFTSSSYEAKLEWERQGGKESGKIGALFYHTQDVDRAVDRGEMSIGYYSFADDDDDRSEDAKVAAAAMEAFAKHGIAATWDGNPNRRIFLTIDWKRRTASSEAREL
ncbi:hypothetical protein OIU34_20085 [Pararhizobium sp. BT-229]|uniref:DUF6891 domain-containing protein n=1 Tax=Pararhizobium sp. BT-229 TaxID=2986923 RepID=UPI0021F6E3BF|nr:hypothetical protein [Pararhizobium sp. BT-229]MCV9964187.1 hypothetical protein [Pararhizobium sp. BT-229]